VIGSNGSSPQCLTVTCIIWCSCNFAFVVHMYAIEKLFMLGPVQYVLSLFIYRGFLFRYNYVYDEKMK